MDIEETLKEWGYQELAQNFIGLAVWFLMNVQTSFEISCKDEEGQDVDWFIVYKLPAIGIETIGTHLRAGTGYAYITSEGTRKWTLSSKSIFSEESILGKTWQSFNDTANKSSEVANLFYNDQPPIRHEGHAIGHLKGYLAFNLKSGIWLSHSIPRFGDSEEYRYPLSGRRNGQIAICLTFETPALNEICHHLLYCNPNVYDYKITSEFKQRLDKVARSIFTTLPIFRRDGILKRQTILRTKEDIHFVAFAKDNQLKEDIYSEILAPVLGANLLVQSWRLGRGSLSGIIQYRDTVTDITSFNMTVWNRAKGIAFNSREDHSKWAISTDSGSRWVCIADLNRMRSQKNRGGGAICFRSKPIWKAFRSIIKTTSQMTEWPLDPLLPPWLEL